MKTHTVMNEAAGEKKVKPRLVERIPNGGWLALSLLAALLFWTILSLIP
ncbi:ABC transporter permease, partial [Virgibacillus halodenitrificans]|nr:ABC transporter permease [Virgibacillus halodenitrificans]